MFLRVQKDFLFSEMLFNSKIRHGCSEEIASEILVRSVYYVQDP